MKATWLSYCGEVVGCIKFTVTNKFLSYSEDLNMIIASSVDKTLKINKKSKAKNTNYSDADNES